MRGWMLVVALSACLSGGALAQQSPPPDSGPEQKNPASPQPDQDKSRDRSAEAGESSSRDTRIDLSPPKDDAKNHPKSGADLSESESDRIGDVQELHPWNPYRATKDEEVGDYYLRRKNYKAALARYQDALTFKDNDALANFRMAQCYEKLDQPEEAIPHYQAYLRILPQGPLSKEARKALEKLRAPAKQTSEKASAKP